MHKNNHYDQRYIGIHFSWTSAHILQKIQHIWRNNNHKQSQICQTNQGISSAHYCETPTKRLWNGMDQRYQLYPTKTKQIKK